MDAICFVLGVETSAIRGAQLEDLIYKEGEKRAPSCSVGLVLRNAQNEEYTFRRSVIGGKSELRINNKKVKLEEYNERLGDFQIDVRAKNFLVLQGHVASIGGGGNGSVLTRLFEEVSGSGELEAEYEELRLLKEKAEETTVLNFQKKRGMDAEKKQFMEQEAEAARYRELLQTQLDTRKEQMVFEISFVNNQMEALNKELEAGQEKVVEQRGRVSIAEDALSAKQKELGKAKRLRLQQDATFAAKLKEHMKLNPGVIDLRKEAEHLTKKIAKSREKEASLQREVDTQQSDLKSLEEQLYAIQRSRKDWEAEVKRQQQKKAISLDEKQLERYNELKEQATRATVADQQRLADLQSRQQLKQDELAGLLAKEEALKARRNDLEQDLRALQSRMEQQHAVAEETKAKVSELEKTAADKERRRKEADASRDALTAALAAAQDELREEKLERKQSERETRFAETLVSLKRLYPGVRGRLSDLTELRQNKYRVATAVAMGRHMDAIVVDDRATAIECLNYMKSQKNGVATFLPLDSIHPKPVLERLRALGGSAKLVVDVLTFDPAIEKAVHYALGNTLVCDSEKEAKELAFGKERQKAVTLSGTVIHKSGMMTGGAANAAQGAARKWNNQKVEALKKKRDSSLEQLERLAHELRALSSTDEAEKVLLAQLSARLKAVEVDLKQLEQKQASIEADMNNVDKEIKAVAPGIKSARAEVDARMRETAAAEKSVNTAEDSVFAKFCVEVGVKNIRQYEREAVTIAKQQNEHRAQLMAQESRVSAALDYAKSRNLDQPRQELAEQMKADAKQLASVQKKLAGLAKQEEAMVADLERLKADVRKHKESEEAAQEAVKQARKAHAEAVDALSRCEKEVVDIEGKIRVLQSRRHAVLRRATVEEVELPYAGEARFTEPVSSQSQVEVFDHENNLEFDFSELRRELRNVASETDFARENAKLEEELQMLQLELVKLNPNLKAVEKLKEVKQKAQTMEKDFKAARDEGTTVTQQFHKCREKRLALFMDCFAFVQKHIAEIYDALTRNDRKSVGGLPLPGGKAFLTLQDSHEPWKAGITYQTIPPTKRLWNFDQLSGGEKSLASLALIFAIQMFKPSPFFVLDEIDAALDAQNVEKVCRYITEQSQSCQFIVISLKDAFYSQADALIGVYKDNDGESSKTLSIDLVSRVQQQ
jgi:structural maintenance of chromosome 1